MIEDETFKNLFRMFLESSIRDIQLDLIILRKKF